MSNFVTEKATTIPTTARDSPPTIHLQAGVGAGASFCFTFSK
jgi:hypothetical protein